MRIFLAALSGMIAMLATFVGGALTAVFFVTSGPVQERKLDLETSGLWTDKPTTVNPHPADLERLPVRSASSSARDATDHQEKTVHQITNSSPEEFGNDLISDAEAGESIDTMTTAAVPSVPDQEEPRSAPETQAKTGHVEWCSHRYRSYRPEDNTYTPYSGGRRECISPYSNSSEANGGYIEASVTADIGELGDEVSSDHIKSCFARYRSYRPEDNTYQPYSGGPRRQCE